MGKKPRLRGLEVVEGGGASPARQAPTRIVYEDNCGTIYTREEPIGPPTYTPPPDEDDFCN